MNFFVLILLVYLGYRFIAGFLIPLFRATRTMRQQFHDVNSRASGQGGPADPGAGASASHSGENKTGSSKVGEYIDFEEIKGK